MANYKQRLTADLDRWIAAGHVAAEKRQHILDSVPDPRRLDAASALAWVGGVLLGIAIIAFIAANWEGMSRLVRFVCVLSVFAAAIAAAAWTTHRGQTGAANGLLAFASIVFAAAIGLTGQIFDIAGDPRAALYTAGVAAALLSAAGRSTGAAIAALVLIGCADFQGIDFRTDEGFDMPGLVIAAPLGAWAALRWGSTPLAHVAALGIIYSFAWFAFRSEPSAGSLLFLCIWLAALAAGARWLRGEGREFASVFYGWFAWAALMFFALAGYARFDGGGFTDDGLGVLHRLVWLVLSGAVIALGRFDRHNLVTTSGILSIVGAIAALLMDLGLDLMTAAAIFFVGAILALLFGLALRRKEKTS